MQSLLRALAAAAAVCAVFAIPSRADDLNNWVTIPAPSDMQGPPNVIGTSITFQTTSDMHLWSGVSKRWTQVPIVSGISFFEQYNDYVIFRDGNSIHAWSTREDVVQTLTVSPSAAIKSGPVTSSWVTLVVDGTQAWGFSAFRGGWTPLTLSAPNPTLFASRITAVIKDGTTLHAFSAFHGTFVTLPADAAASPIIGGEVATACSPGIFRGFSPHQNTWNVVPFSGLTAATAKNGFAYSTVGNSILAYSSYTGATATYAAGSTISGVQNTDDAIGFFDGNDVVCYGAGSGTFSVRNAPGATLQFGLHFAIVSEPGKVTPFSGLLGAFGPTLNGTYSVTTHDVVGYALSATELYGYSAMKNVWVQAPSAAFASPPVLVKGSLVIPYNNAYEAMSARYDHFVNLQTSLTGSYLAPTTGANFLAYFDGSGQTVAVFDSRLDRFALVQGLAPLALKTSRHTAIAHDGVKGFGFGQPTGRWDEVELHSAVAVHDVASEAGYILTGTEFHTYSSLGSLSYEGRFPEFTRILALGNTLWLHQAGPPGSAVVMLVGLNPTYMPVSLLNGTLFIDPTFLLTYPLPVTIPADGLLHLSLPLPQDPVLSGLGPHLQNAVIPPSGNYFLSTSVAPAIF